jgi:MFS family permease
VRGIARRLPFHYGWLIVVVAILSNTIAGGAMFWGTAVYVPAIADDFGVGRTLVVAAFMVGQTVFAFAGPIVGRFIDRNGAAQVIRLSMILAPGALIATSFSSEPWHLFAGWILASIGRTFVMPIPFNWVMTRWFEGRRRQSALGLVTVGFGLGGATMLPLIKMLAENTSWQTAMLVSGVLLFIIQTAAAVLVRDRPSDLGLRIVVADDERRADELDAVEWGLSAREAIRTSAFWLMSIALMLFFVGQGSVTTLAVDFFDSRNVAYGATALSISALIRTVARVPIGIALGRVRRIYLLSVLVMLSQGIATLALVLDPATVGLVIWVALWGIGGAFGPMLEPLLITRTFGVRHFGAVAGTVQMVSFGGQVFGTIGGAALFDLLGTYTVSYLIYTAGVIVGAGMIAMLAVVVGRPVYQSRLTSAGRPDGVP